MRRAVMREDRREYRKAARSTKPPSDVGCLSASLGIFRRDLRQIKLITPGLDYGTAMPTIRICIAVSLALCFAARPARAQFWGNNWGNGWRSRCVPRSKIFNVQALGGSLRGRVSLWRGMTFV